MFHCNQSLRLLRAIGLLALVSVSLAASHPGGILSPSDDDPCSSAQTLEEAMICYDGAGATDAAKMPTAADWMKAANCADCKRLYDDCKKYAGAFLQPLCRKNNQSCKDKFKCLDD